MKIPLSYWLIIMFLRMPLLGHAQNYYSDTSTFDRASAFFSALEVNENGEVISFGGASDTFFILRPNILVHTRRVSGDTTFTFREPLSKRYFSAKSTKTLLGPLVVGSCPHTDSAGNPVNSTFALRVDSMGNLLQFKEFFARPGVSELRMVDAVALGAKIYVLAREAVQASRPHYNIAIFILEDSSLDVYATYTFGLTNRDEYPLRIIKAYNNSLVVGGFRTDNTITGMRDFQTWIFSIDTSGNILNQYISSIPGREFGPSAMISNSHDGVTFISLKEKHLASSNSFTSQAFIAKLNTQLQLEWDSIYGQESHWVAPRDMVQKPDGRLFSCGEIGISSGTLNLYYGWLNAHTPTGGHIWQRFYLPFGNGELEQGQLDAIRAHPDGGFVMAGQARAYGPSIVKAQHAWLLKVDSLGCLVPGCAVGIKELTPEPVYLKVWPNPAQGEAFVLYKSTQELPEAYLVLTDMLGRERRRAPVPEMEAQYHLQLFDLDAGLYMVQLWSNGRILANEKLLIYSK